MSKTVLFDLDRTLLDRDRSIERFLPDQYRRCAPEGAGAPTEFIARFRELDRNGYGDKRLLYETLCGEFRLTLLPDELIADYRANCYRNVYLYRGARELLVGLRRRGYRLGLVTNGSSLAQRAKIEGADLAGLFEVILVSGELGVHKPDARIFEQAAGMLGADEGECTFVGDNPERDVLGAAGAGMRTVWVSHGESWPDCLRLAPDQTVSEVGEAKSIL